MDTAARAPQAPGLFDRVDPACAFHGTAAGIDQATARDGGRWAELAFDAVLETARRRPGATFTTDDVLAAFPELERIPERRVLGGRDDRGEVGGADRADQPVREQRSREVPQAAQAGVGVPDLTSSC